MSILQAIKKNVNYSVLYNRPLDFYTENQTSPKEIEYERPDIEDINRWKEKYKNIYKIETKKAVYYIRECKRKELEEITKEHGDDLISEDILVLTCLLFPQINTEEINAGIISNLARAILKVSGYSVDPKQQEKEITDLRNELMNSIDKKIDAIILSNFPNLNPKDLYEMTNKERMEYFVLSEFMLLNLKGFPPDVYKKILSPPRPQKNVFGPLREQYIDVGDIPNAFKSPEEKQRIREAQNQIRNRVRDVYRRAENIR